MTSPIELESLQRRVREEFEKLIDEKQDVGWIDFGSSSIVAEGIKSFLDAATKDAWEAGYYEGEKNEFQNRAGVCGEWNAALDAVVRAMPEKKRHEDLTQLGVVEQGSIGGKLHYECEYGKQYGFNECRTALLEKIGELRKI